MKDVKNSVSNIKDYYKRIGELKTAGGTQKETAIRKAFLEMVDKYAKEYQLIIVDELNQIGTRNCPDAGLQSSIGFNFGYIENKDIYDNIEIEIEKKIKKGYDLTNIIFENTQWIILYQNKNEIYRGYIGEENLINKRITEEEFERVIKQFVSYEPLFVSNFKEALEKFKEKVPEISIVLRKLIQEQQKSNTVFIEKLGIFLKDCQDAINKEVSTEDIGNMIVQHILTRDIFDSIFDDQQFHKYNSIAKSIEEITNTFFTKEKEMELTKSIRGYYQAIINSSKAIHDHRQKQSFLKTIYQEFYKAYNPSKADRQGVEYTPIEIVSFMIKITDLLLLKHFEQRLEDDGVEILDPCTGTGIFISELLYEISHNNNFDNKFENEIFCNEIDILPYYIANLNIEYIRAQIKGSYKEFKNIVLVDTLNNIASLKNSYFETKYSKDLFSEDNRKAFNENNEKIKKQNEAKLKVIIGNPPYNSNQQNENDNNKNFSYPHIDQRIKETYIKKSTAQKTKQFDMYKRFIRWASDRMDEQKGGIVAFITNNAYLDAKQDDGFRASVREEFDYAYFVNLKGDVRRNSKISGTKHNVFGIQTGVGIMFLIKNGDNQGRCEIKYIEVDDYATKDEKLDFLNKMMVQVANNVSLRTYNELIGNFTKIIPNERNQWLGQVENDWQDLVPLILKDCKNGKNDANAIFKLYSLGVATNRDKWVYDINKNNLEKKVKKLIEIYHQELERNKEQINELNRLKKSTVDNKDEGGGLTKHYLEHRKWEYSLDLRIKWSRDLKKDAQRNLKLTFDKSCIKESMYRPFVKKYIYYSHGLNDVPGHFSKIFPNDGVRERVICFNGSNNMRWEPIIFDNIPDLNALYGGSMSIPLHTYPDKTTKMPNLTDFGRKVFEEKYGKVSDEEIFYYCYGVLNGKSYKEKYKENLKVDLPRIPLLEGFHKLSEYGKQLADLHINYENAEKYKLELFEIPQKAIPDANKEAIKRDFKPNIYLRVNKESGEIKLDDYHILKGIPKEAFEYKIGNKSPIEWVCNDNCFSPLKYNLKEENEKLLAELDEYNWEEVKEHLMDLIPRLVTVSLKTAEILKQIDELE